MPEFEDVPRFARKTVLRIVRGAVLTARAGPFVMKRQSTISRLLKFTA
jgi:hypothetical protein